MGSGFSNGSWLYCSLLAPIAHSSPQNLLTCHLIYQLAGYSLDPFEERIVDDPAEGYPECLHILTLKGYFGEVFAAIVAQHFSPFEVDNWEVPAFLFRFHVVELQHIEALNQIGGEVKRRP